MTRQTAGKAVNGEDINMDASCCKLFTSETVGKVADRTLQIFGGAGYMVETGIERLYRDVRVMRIYEGTSQIQQIVIARHMLDRYRQGLMA